ncbi:hypothetical protein GUITHDRAFT_122722 [Guillardia theta CCMP2712]|uniref:Uncharacterized protein n=1 Tax=Guillardia theta (strain CCMP2712) TaxID=905079 RepID=L1I5A7_GUITC|nr:hypothetical protein GUITHDRAFT_122722 [Guillardia theta CCMP2712]EKX31074.1 hypothetical protein GUITHDRAFT_122722 [Guillardia theta CCMP2712]|eukprot:XP_005818054.1 hypothetical protein GUITHDRAFT_122722 [Guillardia theta CCMP2712]
MKSIINRQGNDSKPRNVINDELALYIFACRPIEKAKPIVSSSILALRFGITPKAIRDIWRRRTWVRATLQDWTVKERETYEGDEICEGCLYTVSGEKTICNECQKIKRTRREKKTPAHAETDVKDDPAPSDSHDVKIVGMAGSPAQVNEVPQGGVCDEFSRSSSSHHNGWLMDAERIGYFLNN